MTSSHQGELDRLRTDHANKLRRIKLDSHSALEDEITRMANDFNAMIQDQARRQFLNDVKTKILQIRLYELSLDNKQSKRNIRTHSKIGERLALFRDFYPPGHIMRTEAIGIEGLTKDECSVGQKAYRHAIVVIDSYSKLKKDINHMKTQVRKKHLGFKKK